MKTMLLAGAALAAVFAATGASAATVGWYGAADIGYNWANTLNTRTALVNNLGQNVTVGHFAYSAAPMGDLRLGYKFNSNWRLEGELGYRENGLRSVSLENSGATFTGIAGNSQNITGMLNLLYDFDPMGAVTPFVGIGEVIQVDTRTGEYLSRAKQ